MLAPRSGAQSVFSLRDVSCSKIYAPVVFEEQYKFKMTKREEQHKYEELQIKDPSLEYDIIVKASNPKRKVSTVVRDNSITF